MGVVDFFSMYNAYLDWQEVRDDWEMRRTAWQTSLIMNSAGGIKKRIKPDQLYKPKDFSKESHRKVVNQEYVQSEKDKLLEIIGQKDGKE